MSTPAVDRFLASAHIAPRATPHEAAAHVWTRVVATNDIAADGPLTELGVFDRVVLVLRDVLDLSDETVAQVLHSEPADIRTAHDTARLRLGLPGIDAVRCDGWDAVREAHDPGDTAVLAGLVAHVGTCPTCGDALTAAQDRRWGPRATGSAARRTSVLGVTPALAGALGAAAVLVTAGVATGAAMAPLPTDPLPQPILVDADPGLPTDQEPLEGWPPPIAPTPAPATDEAVDEAQDGAEGTQGTTGTDTPSDDGTGDPTTGDAIGDTLDAIDETTDTVDDALDDATNSVTDALDELTDPLQDTADAVEDLDGEVELTP